MGPAISGDWRCSNELNLQCKHTVPKIIIVTGPGMAGSSGVQLWVERDGAGRACGFEPLPNPRSPGGSLGLGR